MNIQQRVFDCVPAGFTVPLASIYQQLPFFTARTVCLALRRLRASGLLWLVSKPARGPNRPSLVTYARMPGAAAPAGQYCAQHGAASSKTGAEPRAGRHKPEAPARGGVRSLRRGDVITYRG